MKSFLLVFCFIAIVSCGKDGKNGASGTNGIDAPTVAGLEGSATNVELEDIAPGVACANGGISIYTFRDTNTDGIFQSDERVIKAKAICNGINGINGASTSITVENIASSTLCPAGGVRIIKAASDPVEVCNGLNGINGQDGLPGTNGLPGMNGTDGVSSIIPVQFCSTDKSTFPEYGLLIGDDLFAVHWARSKAYLTKLVAGDYKSTGGNNCLFNLKD